LFGGGGRKRPRENDEMQAVIEKPVSQYCDANQSRSTHFDPKLKIYVPKFVGHDPAHPIYSAICSPDGRYGCSIDDFLP
jgi:hypothetical protein